MISTTAVIIVGVVCLLVEAFFSGSEIALVSANRARLRHRAEGGDSRAQKVQKFLQQPERMLATTLLGTNLATITFSATVALALISSETANEYLAIAIVTPCTLIFGEMVPKTIFQRYADVLAPRVITPLSWASTVLRPVVTTVSAAATAVTRWAGTTRREAFVTRDELALLLEAESAQTDSEITDDEREMISNVLELSESKVGDVMVPLSEVTALPVETALVVAAAEVADKQHSRMPVFEGRVDRIVGLVHVFDLLQAGPRSRTVTVGDVKRDCMFVPESMLIADVFRQLRTGSHMAVVVDEYGGATGIVTVEDIVEEVVGEIDDEYDDEPSPIEQERAGVWRVLGRTSIERLNEELNLLLPESEEYESVAGMLLEHFRRIPKEGESVVLGGATLRILQATERSIEAVQILRRKR